ncbi:cytochrome P450 [Mycobacterium intermedium]|uniref:Cytochrome P450 n=1 Tax=Mycobacterium intermedium TaxID=28445 RepID=A0A1E3SB85_MYCIE|nr:cytochrome P450 [Mycobacterium intermedium]MCV6967462.1 cytochrome P450 [Mycobacterium intermedium]ODQ99354.1 cytochrome P450 [Mycobacterium intermedium]OPE50015.1 cytochrome P450 [Mycobacterium intermedium]ORB07816.1 cytochrome P450 [Mycobacterium intermedium]
MPEQTTDPVRLPPGPALPRFVQAIGFVASRQRGLVTLQRRWGDAFTLHLPIIGPAVVISDPALIKDLFTGGSELLRRPGNLGKILGPGSTFSLDGAEHLRRRKLLVPPFHGRRMTGYESIVEEEVLRETANWPEGQEFETLQPMMRITLNTILRTVFGAQGAEFDELREILPRWVTLTSRMAALPPALRRDFGPRSPWGRAVRYRRRYDDIVASLIRQARKGAEKRGDVLALLLAARYEDGSPIADEHVGDELLTLLAAGHETTATTLAWTVERIRRHPRLLARLAEEADAGGSRLRQATIWEVQRTRPVIEATSRMTNSRIRLGPWVIPPGYAIVASATLVHDSETNFTDATRFDPDRFLDRPPDNNTWIPFGGGVRRCIGAAFANMEMNVTLRTLLREFEFAPTDAPGERTHLRGVATAPAKGGRAVVYRRVSGAPGRAEADVHRVPS